MYREKARYRVGQLVQHKSVDYRGVIVDVDPYFQNSDEWYMLMAKSKPSKEQPWYHVLVDDTHYMTYVAEEHLEEDDSGLPITHPDLPHFFSKLVGGFYVAKRSNH